MRKECEACGGEFEPENARHRFCSDTCRKRGSRGATVAPVRDGDTLEAATCQALEDAGREDTPAGVSAVLLARKLDMGGDTGSSMAALAREHRAALEDALRGAEVVDDPVDELRDRRRKRLRSSG